MCIAFFPLFSSAKTGAKLFLLQEVTSVTQTWSVNGTSGVPFLFLSVIK